MPEPGYDAKPLRGERGCWSPKTIGPSERYVRYLLSMALRSLRQRFGRSVASGVTQCRSEESYRPVPKLLKEEMMRAVTALYTSALSRGYVNSNDFCMSLTSRVFA